MDKIYFNGQIHSLDCSDSVYEAIGIINDKIAALGSNESILKLQSEHTVLYDLENNAVYPGFIDSHMHMLEYALQQERVDLSDVKSIDELVLVMKTTLNDQSKNRIHHPWLIGRCFNQDNFIDKRIPNKEDLNKISTEVPIVIFRVCLHVAVVNDKALELLFSEDELPNVQGGEISLDSFGKPNGLLTENALLLIYDKWEKPDVSAIKEMIMKASKELASCGITSVHSDDFGSVGNYEDVITAFSELGNEKLLNVRVTQQCLIKDNEKLNDFIKKGYVLKKVNPYYSLGPLKILSDGSLGARTAYLKTAYVDDQSTRGVFVESKEELLEKMKIANDAGMQIAVHAIGNAAIESILDCFKELESLNLKKYKSKNFLRHGIVHCQITDTILLNRFKSQEILAYVQPIFLEYDLHMVEDRVGKELASTSYAFRTLMDNNVHTSGGSDCPVEHFNIMNNIYCSVARKDLYGEPKQGFYKSESVTMRQALQMFTIEGAYASREEALKGSLETGKYADFVVLDSNLYSVNEDEIRNVKVLLTVMGGEITYANQKS